MSFKIQFLWFIIYLFLFIILLENVCRINNKKIKFPKAKICSKNKFQKIFEIMCIDTDGGLILFYLGFTFYIFVLEQSIVKINIWGQVIAKISIQLLLELTKLKIKQSKNFQYVYYVCKYHFILLFNYFSLDKTIMNFIVLTNTLLLQ